MAEARVLVVDDDEPVRKMVALTFEMEGFEVGTATDGVDAIVQRQLFEPDVVVMDIMMPRMDGLTVLGHFRRQEATASLPVLLLSAKADSQDVTMGLRVGADDYVTKPFDATDLVQRTREVLEKAAARPRPAPAAVAKDPVVVDPPAIESDGAAGRADAPAIGADAPATGADAAATGADAPATGAKAPLVEVGGPALQPDAPEVPVVPAAAELRPAPEARPAPTQGAVRPTPAIDPSRWSRPATEPVRSRPLTPATAALVCAILLVVVFLIVAVIR